MIIMIGELLMEKMIRNNRYRPDILDFFELFFYNIKDNLYSLYREEFNKIINNNLSNTNIKLYKCIYIKI